MRSQMLEWAKTRKESKLVSHLIPLYYLLYFVNLRAATLTGYIPVHTIRLLLYKHLFRVDVAPDAIIYRRCRFNEPVGGHIGHHSIIGGDAILDGRRGLFVGNNVNIAGESHLNSP
jgi:hypothetical protein